MLDHSSMKTKSANSSTENSTGESQRFTRAQRLRSGRDFERVYARKLRAGNEHLLIFADRSPTQTTRIGLSVSRKNGNSVIRHRIRRLLKEAFRLAQHDIPEGIDMILIPRPGSNSTVLDYQKALVSLSRKLTRRIASD
ncbi:Ribonuclease P protein component [Thalassoglobus neptunius]|uniref:Ribonuclease P protein component n=1 Tax=Thalassoglobus neptunius TaxID=1938619 RepID=A0A5C5WAR4_9PLAN|nr:ribonuclease P protein component [Thalassoglobus neptunius]TWT47101.1 Ribonuclease P protein component [Thalassoglobus neptunius]